MARRVEPRDRKIRGTTTEVSYQKRARAGLRAAEIVGRGERLWAEVDVFEAGKLRGAAQARFGELIGLVVVAEPRRAAQDHASHVAREESVRAFAHLAQEHAHEL